MTDSHNRSCRVTVAMLGARMHYAVPRLLHECGLLERFHTDNYIDNKPWLKAIFQLVPSIIRPRGIERWLGRTSDSLPPDMVVSHDILGLWYAFQRWKASRNGNINSVYGEVERRFANLILREPLKGDVVWGFNGAALTLFKEAKKQGLNCILEQTSNPKPLEHQLAVEEQDRCRVWITPNDATMPVEDGEIERVREEWRLADRLVVGSEFVANGLAQCDVARSKISVIPYAVDLNRFRWTARTRRDPSGPIRVLFVGRISVMKGIPDLLNALKSLPSDHVKARLVGKLLVNDSKLSQYSSCAEIIGPVARSQILEHYQWADVFCFPSITEGSATVTYEAIASGLPVITTPNSGSIVTHDIDGLIVPIRDPLAIAKAICSYFEDPELLARHQLATKTTREKAGLPRYGRELERLVTTCFPGSINHDELAPELRRNTHPAV